MTITYARAQAAVASDDNTDPAMASFGSAVTEGNLLVVTAIERSGGSAANFVISDNGSDTGWTKRVSETTEQANSSARRTHVVWERVATATDAAQSPFTVSVDDGTASGKMCLADEFTAGATVTWAFEDVVAANTGTGSTSPLASGSTASVSGTLLLVGSAVWRLGTGGQTNIAFSGLSGVASGVGANNGRSVASAWAQDATTGTKSTSVSWDGTGHEGNVALLVFSATEGGGGNNFTETPTDNEGLTDARAFDHGKSLAEAEGLTDAATREFDRPIAETLGLTDTIESVVSREQTATDPLGLTDAIQTEAGKAAAPADDLGLTDATTIVADFQRDQVDALGLTDTVQIGGDTSLGLTDDADLTDSAVTVGDFQRTATDAIGITDALTVDVGKLASLGDDLGATDALVFDVGQGPAETVGLTDALVFEIEKVLVDAAAVADAAAVVADYERSITDTLGLTDLREGGVGLPDLNPIKLSFREPARHLTHAEAAHVVGRESRHVTYQEG